MTNALRSMLRERAIASSALARCTGTSPRSSVLSDAIGPYLVSVCGGLVVVADNIPEAKEGQQDAEGEMDCVFNRDAVADEQRTGNEQDGGAHSGRPDVCQPACRAQEKVRVIELDLGGDTARQPVLNPLHASLRLVKPQKLGDFRRPSKQADAFGVCLNELFGCVHQTY